MSHTQYDYDKLFLAYEESRADITAHFRKIIELEREIEALKAAYEEAQVRIKQLESQCEMINDLLLENKLLKNQLCFTNSSWPHEKKLHEKIEQLKSDNEKLRAELVRVRDEMIEVDSQNDDRCWYNLETILRQLVDSIDEVLK